MVNSEGTFYRPLFGVETTDEGKGIWPEGENWVVVALLMPVMLCGIFYYKEKKRNSETVDVKEEKKNKDLVRVAKEEKQG